MYKQAPCCNAFRQGTCNTWPACPYLFLVGVTGIPYCNAPVIVAGNQVQGGCSHAHPGHRRGDWTSAATHTAQCVQTAPPQCSSSFPPCMNYPSFSCIAARVCRQCHVHSISNAENVYVGLTVPLLSGLLPCSLLSTSQMSCFTGCSSKSAASQRLQQHLVRLRFTHDLPAHACVLPSTTGGKCRLIVEPNP